MEPTGDPLEHPAFARPNSWRSTGGGKKLTTKKPKKPKVERCSVFIKKNMQCEKDAGHLGEHRKTIIVEATRTTTIWARENPGTAVWRVGTYEEAKLFP